MRAIILAAGQGKRLRPLTDDRPKCLVELGGVTLLERQLTTLRQHAINDITVVGGYRAELLKDGDYRLVVNPNYATGNMVASLFCARESLRADQDLVIAYGDILYESRVLGALLDGQDPICLVVDHGWREYWNRRMADPLTDAETLKLDRANYVRELGKRAQVLSEIEGQYIGLIKVQSEFVPQLVEAYERMDRNATYDGKPFPQMYMTSFLQHLIELDWPVRAVLVDHGWLEVDTLDDLRLYQRLLAEGELARFYDPAAVIMTSAAGVCAEVGGWWSRTKIAAQYLPPLRGLVESLPAPRIRFGSFSLEQFLFELVRSDQLGASESFERLERLCRSIEVKRRLYAYYTSDLAHSVEKSWIAPEYVALAVSCYLAAAEADQDPKFLNTALKLLDGVLQGVSIRFPQFLRDWAQALLDRTAIPA